MPVGVQCPISSSLGEFPSYWDWLRCPGLSSVLVSIALPFAFHTWCFPFALICHWVSIVFLLYSQRIATHSVDPSLTHFLGEFPGFGLLWYPMLWSQRRIYIYIKFTEIYRSINKLNKVKHLFTYTWASKLKLKLKPELNRKIKPKLNPKLNNLN